MAHLATNRPPEREHVEAVQRRTLRVVVVGQVLGGAGLAAGVTVGALLAEEMLGNDSLAGLPVALFTLGSALAAFLVGRSTQRVGRRLGLAAGFTAGGIGAVGVVVAASTDSLPLLFVSLFLYGSGSATNLQARYAGTDLAPANRRGTAISVALTSTTLGAVAGPNLVVPLGHMAEVVGIPPLAGPFALAAVAYLAAGTALLVLLRPDPLLLARSLTPPLTPSATDTSDRTSLPPASETATEDGDPPAGPRVSRISREALLGGAVMVLTQVSMVAIMTMTPVHLKTHHHGLGAVGLVISIHIGSMYLPSPLTGTAVDRFGRAPLVVAAAITLLAAGLVAALAPGESLPLVVLALALLGLGWNFGLISGTALVVDGTDTATRPGVQGSIDVLVALAGATGGVASGAVVSASSYATLAIGVASLSMVLLPILAWARASWSSASPTSNS